MRSASAAARAAWRGGVAGIASVPPGSKYPETVCSPRTNAVRREIAAAEGFDRGYSYSTADEIHHSRAPSPLRESE